MTVAWTVDVDDGFDHYALANATWKYQFVVGALSSIPGPVYGNGVRFPGGGSYLQQGVTAATSSRGGCAWLRVSTSGFPAGGAVCPAQLAVYGLSGYTLVQALFVHSDGSVSVRRGVASAWSVVIAASAAGVFPLGQWNYVQWSTSGWGAPGGGPGVASGRVDVAVNGTYVITAPHVQTTDTGAIGMGPMRWGNCLSDGNTATVDVDDTATVFTSETSGEIEPDPAHWPNPHAVLTLYPVAAGDSTALVPHGAASNWQCCAEPLGDGDATYVFKPAGTAAIDLYRVQAWPGPTPPTGYDEQWTAAVQSLARDDPAGVGGYGRAIARLKYTDENGAAQDFPVFFTVPSAEAYRYAGTGLQPSGNALSTIQVGWGATVGEAGDAGDQFRGSQCVVEVWHPAGRPPPSPGVGHGFAIWWP